MKTWTTAISPLYESYSIQEKLEAIVQDLAEKEQKRENDWLRSCFQRYAQGVVVLVDSGQKRAASIYATLQGFHIAVHHNGARTFMRHDVSLELLPPSQPLLVDETAERDAAIARMTDPGATVVYMTKDGAYSLVLS